MAGQSAIRLGEIIMPKYELLGKIIEVGEKISKTYIATCENEARALAENDGIAIENIRCIPEDPPSVRQITFARDLGIILPEGASKVEVTDLISLKVDNDKPSSELHQSFAKKFGVNFTQYIGKKALFDKIHCSLSASGKEKELVSWFTFRVYRELVKSQNDVSIDSPDHPVIQNISSELYIDSSILKSIRRYEGRELIWFGEYKGYKGGSNQTIAYKRVASMLRDKVALNEYGYHKNSRSSTIRHSPRTSVLSKQKSSGCLSIFAHVFIGFVLSLVAIVWIARLNL